MNSCMYLVVHILQLNFELSLDLLVDFLVVSDKINYI